jgi:Cu(I)/Ag(I) efflux system protein CusF
MKTRWTLCQKLAILAGGFLMASGVTQASPGLNLNVSEKTSLVHVVQGLFAPAPAIAQNLVEGRGKVIAVTQEKQELVLEHGEIKGFMDPMTMGYKVSSPSLLKGLKPGDQVRFTIDKNKSVITKITKLPNSSK